MRFIILLAACVAACSASGCKTSAASENLQVLPASYKSHENYALFGKLTACPRINEELTDSLRFVITPKDDINVVLLNEQFGDFMFLPSTDYIGIISFLYHVEDDIGISESSTVTIKIQPKTVSPSINVATHIIGLEDRDTELDFQIDDIQDQRWNDLSVAICSCANDVTCIREEGCHCHLSLPDGWQIFNGDQQLTLEELKSLSPSDVGNLFLRAAPSSAAQHCLDVHVIDPSNEDNPSTSKKSFNIHIQPIHTVFMKPQNVVSSVRPEVRTPEIWTSVPVNLTTSQGRPFVFHDLQVVDVDGIEGTYMVTVHLDQGGLLWVKQDLRQDVVFLPLTEEIHPEVISARKIYNLFHRFGTFKSGNRPFDLEENNNGVKVLRFIGSLKGINEVLSTLTFVPWCSDWPVPPSWPVPAKSWMDDPTTLTEDLHHPTIWPQWYPRFWYPFPSTHWSWWPRVVPPWWLSSSCSNWTSTLRMRVEEVPAAVTCQETPAQTVSEWSASILVNANGNTPKSLVTVNHFSYFQQDAHVVTIDTIHLRSSQYNLGENITVNLTVLESNYASVEFPSTGLNYTLCQTIEQCNEHLTNIKVTFKDGVQDVCLVTVQVDMYRNGSSKLLDTLVVWAVNTTRRCADITSTHPNFELTPRSEGLSVMQGSVDNPLHLMSNVDEDDTILPGILHVKLFAEHGIITMKVPDGIRIYSDHMGQHEGISSYLCIAGPVPMVLEALAAARFTPFEPLKGQTVVTVDYRMPSTASQLLYGNVKLFRRTQVTIRVYGGISPYMPVVVRPQEMCTPDSNSLYINQTAVLRRFKEEERVTFSVTPDIGSLQLDTSHKAMYECPEEPSLDMSVDNECSNNLDCQDNLLCCSNGQGLTCMEGTLKANALLLTTGQVYMHGDTERINEMISHNAIRYVPAPCIDDETYTDNINIRVNPSRNQEGDDVRADIPIHVICNTQSPNALSLIQYELNNCEWSDWTSCLIEGGVCGLGSQRRRQICNSEDVVETRPCLNCTCAPVPTTFTDPSPETQECSSETPVSRCPEGCSVGTCHTEMVTFLCQPTSQEEEYPNQVERLDIKIHDSCVCNYCSSYQYQRDD